MVKLYGFCLSIAYIVRRRHSYIESWWIHADKEITERCCIILWQPTANSKNTHIHVGDPHAENAAIHPDGLQCLQRYSLHVHVSFTLKP